jgi:hypothetical protein
MTLPSAEAFLPTMMLVQASLSIPSAKQPIETNRKRSENTVFLFIILYLIFNFGDKGTNISRIKNGKTTEISFSLQKKYFRSDKK